MCEKCGYGGCLHDQRQREAAGKTHELKTWPEYYNAIRIGAKTFEVRYDDRGFQVGDTLNLMEYDPEREMFTGEYQRRVVTYVLRGGQFGIAPGYVVLGITGPNNRGWHR